jgi:hypothetical protein
VKHSVIIEIDIPEEDNITPEEWANYMLKWAHLYCIENQNVDGQLYILSENYQPKILGSVCSNKPVFELFKKNHRRKGTVKDILRRHPGKYVALDQQGKVLSFGTNAEEVEHEARSTGYLHPAIFYSPIAEDKDQAQKQLEEKAKKQAGPTAKVLAMYPGQYVAFNSDGLLLGHNRRHDNVKNEAVRKGCLHPVILYSPINS